MNNRQQFYASLAELMRKHNVQFNAVDDAKPYGMHQPLVEIEFDDGSIELSSLDAEDATLLANCAT